MVERNEYDEILTEELSNFGFKHEYYAFMEYSHNADSHTIEKPKKKLWGIFPRTETVAFITSEPASIKNRSFSNLKFNGLEIFVRDSINPEDLEKLRIAAYQLGKRIGEDVKLTLGKDEVEKQYCAV
ncbi:MAG: hypothetical protein PHD81_00715 [Candidatus Nanoarchaeia archaeon]|nr:hypothetical protein [Candidatus Nanoarchaeia archaeon]MDD5587612.1 hypothetical protein [Candidatus Nanoarchaeia archaeon]